MKARERNLGIELLRIICMMCMIIQHIIGHGWVIQSLHPDTWKYELVESLRILCIFGISCFALISGYVGVRARYKYSALVMQWSKMWLYSVFFTALGSVLVPGSVSKAAWIEALFPTLHTLFWYFSAYLACFLIAPFIRKGMRAMSFKQASVMVAMMVVAFTMLTHVFDQDAFYVGGGKNSMWLVAMYVIGAYFGWFRPHEKVPMTRLWGFAAAATLLLVSVRPVAMRLNLSMIDADVKGNSLWSLMMAVAMLLLFSRLEIRRGRKLISWLGGASFSVYVLHEHPQIRRYTISKYSYLLTYLGNVQIVVGIVLAAAGVYVVCALVDALRQKLYDALRVKQRLEALENRLIGDLWAD